MDNHNHDSLRALLAEHEIDGLWTDEEVLAISQVWHYLDGWPDCTRGLQALKDQGYVVCTLSNGNLNLLRDMADFANLPWTHVFSAEDVGAYKPHASVYLGAWKKLDLESPANARWWQLTWVTCKRLKNTACKPFILSEKARSRGRLRR